MSCKTYKVCSGQADLNCNDGRIRQANQLPQEKKEKEKGKGKGKNIVILQSRLKLAK
jgi:hypothetical protein